MQADAIADTVALVTTDLTSMPAKDIDTELARIYDETQRQSFYLASARSHRDHILAQPVSSGRTYRLDEADAEVNKVTAKLAELRAEAQPYEDEFTRRGGWNRYFLVTNSNGHVHRGMNCTTCFFTTQYAWLPELSDCVEADAIGEFGEKMCTVCFPDAPADPRFNAPGRRDAAAKAAREHERAILQARKDRKNLAPELQFKDLSDWKVTTVAGAKQCLRDCVYTLTIAGTSADYNDYEARRRPQAQRIHNTALDVLGRKGVPANEIAKLIENAEKKAKKEIG